MNVSETELARLHYEMIQGLLEEGACPGNEELAKKLNISHAHVEDILRGLSDIHGVVLHPHVCEPWVIHPFSLTPTMNWVQSTKGGWWAPCVWCACGIAALAGGEVSIHTRYGGEAETLVISLADAQPVNHHDTWVHFAIPPAQAWANVHQHCALVLPFRSRDQVAPWCLRHRVPEGEIIPLQQVANLARVWYGSHASPNWRKWTMTEAQEIFYQAGLRAPFWDLGSKAGRF